MRSLRVLSFFLFVMVVGVVAEAQCLRCYRPPGWPIGQGLCGESTDGYCDRRCCGSYEGAPCQQPDFLDPCWWVSSKAGEPQTVLRAVKRGPMPYFATRQPLQRHTEMIYRQLKQTAGCGKRA
jgi:hypothetical protein